MISAMLEKIEGKPENPWGEGRTQQKVTAAFPEGDCKSLFFLSS